MSEPAETKTTGGIAPFGYQWHGGSLVINEREAPTRKRIYELFLKHRRKKTVAKVLNDEGYRTRSGAKFSDTTIDRLIRDTTAKGIRLNDGKEIKVEAIVENELWERANNILSANSNQKPTKQVVRLFSGYAFCFCGGKMITPSNSEKYVCPKCRHKIRTDDLEEIFVSQLTGFLIPIEKEGQTEETSLSDCWQYLAGKEKRIVIEQILSKIIIGTESIEIEFGCAPDSFKTAAFGQQSQQGNKTPSLAPRESVDDARIQPITEPLMNEATASKFLGISKMTLLRRRNAGKIGFFRVGFRVLYSKEKHLIPFLEQCEKGQ